MVSHLVPEILTFAYAWINVDISQNKSHTRIHMWCFVRHQGNVSFNCFHVENYSRKWILFSSCSTILYPHGSFP